MNFQAGAPLTIAEGGKWCAYIKLTLQDYSQRLVRSAGHQGFSAVLHL